MDLSDQKTTKKIYFVYCHAKGHRREDCFKLKRKEQAQLAATKPASPSTVSAVSEEVAPRLPQSTVASVSLNSENEPCVTSDSNLIVQVLNYTNLSALLDNGSPISFICPSVFEKFFNTPISSLSENLKSCTVVNRQLFHRSKFSVQFLR